MKVQDLTTDGRINTGFTPKATGKEYNFTETDGSRPRSYTVKEIRDLTSDLEEMDRYSHLGVRTADLKFGGCKNAQWRLSHMTSEIKRQFSAPAQFVR
jgi:hypothetical protein